jgi:hypothetical protein
MRGSTLETCLIHCDLHSLAVMRYAASAKVNTSITSAQPPEVATG